MISNRVTASYVQVQLAGDSTRISHQNLWSRRIIGIRYEEVPMLITHVIPSIIANNWPDMTVSTGFIQEPQALKMPVMQEFVAVMTPYNTWENRTPQRVIRTGSNGYTTDVSGNITSAVDSCISPKLPSICIWNVSNVNIGQNTNPKSRETS